MSPSRTHPLWPAKLAMCGFAADYVLLLHLTEHPLMKILATPLVIYRNSHCVIRRLERLECGGNPVYNKMDCPLLELTED